MPIEVESHGADDAARRLRGLAAAMIDLRPLWPKMRSLFQRQMREQFSSQGAWGGKVWAPVRRQRGRSILVDTGMMRGAFTGGRGFTSKATARALTITINDSGTDKRGKERPKGVAIYHQSGTANMPARPIIPQPYPDEGVREAVDVATEWADDLVRRWGF